MIKTLIATALLTATISTAPAPAPKNEPVWEPIGEWRITTYDIYCNEPQGRESSSGKTLEYGYVAMNGVPMGSEISIDGEVFEVADRCGIDGTVDIFIENDSDHCQCDTLDYKEVYIKTNKKKGGQN